MRSVSRFLVLPLFLTLSAASGCAHAGRPGDDPSQDLLSQAIALQLREAADGELQRAGWGVDAAAIGVLRRVASTGAARIVASGGGPTRIAEGVRAMQTLVSRAIAIQSRSARALPGGSADAVPRALAQTRVLSGASMEDSLQDICPLYPIC